MLANEVVGAFAMGIPPPLPIVTETCIFHSSIEIGETDLAALAQAVRHRSLDAKAGEGVGARLPISFMGERERRKSGSARAEKVEGTILPEAAVFGGKYCYFMKRKKSGVET